LSLDRLTSDMQALRSFARSGSCSTMTCDGSRAVTRSNNEWTCPLYFGRRRPSASSSQPRYAHQLSPSVLLLLTRVPCSTLEWTFTGCTFHSTSSASVPLRRFSVCRHIVIVFTSLHGVTLENTFVKVLALLRESLIPMFRCSILPSEIFQ